MDCQFGAHWRRIVFLSSSTLSARIHTICRRLRFREGYFSVAFGRRPCRNCYGLRGCLAIGLTITSIPIVAAAEVASHQNALSSNEARVAVATYAKDHASPQQLSANEIGVAQRVARTLLAAQAHRPASASNDNLRKEVRALYKSLDSAVNAAMQSPPRYEFGRVVTKSSISVGSPVVQGEQSHHFQLVRGAGNHLTFKLIPGANTIIDGKSAAVPQMIVQQPFAVSTESDPFSSVRDRLASLKVQLSKSAQASAQVGPANSARRLRSEGLLVKVRALHKEIDAAINAKRTPENIAQLAKLRDRLKESSISQLMAESHTPMVSTPTFATLIHHR